MYLLTSIHKYEIDIMNDLIVVPACQEEFRGKRVVFSNSNQSD